MRQQTGSLGALPHSTSLVFDNFFSENTIFIPTSDMYCVEVLLNAEHGTPTSKCNQLNLNHFPFDPGAKCVTISIRLPATDLFVWDPRINFTFIDLTGYTVNVDALQMQGCSGRYCLIAYSNSMTRVWDPGQQGCVNSNRFKVFSIVDKCNALTCHLIAYSLVFAEY
ncbi:hypothetical protein KY289_026233 [Solanum tuberosum]|nr:hypothetical protein KY289_026233 [Solanum tuberosum]